MTDAVNIKNRRAYFDYEILDTFIAGMMLLGTEIKSIRLGHVTIRDAHCYFDNGELFVKGVKIEPLKEAAHNNHDPERPKKLLLNKKEIVRISKEIDAGKAVVCTKLFINERGLAKLEIATARGKKKSDKRQTIKKREADREMKKI